jgi:hypothetical protein
LAWQFNPKNLHGKAVLRAEHYGSVGRAKWNKRLHKKSEATSLKVR